MRKFSFIPFVATLVAVTVFSCGKNEDPKEKDPEKEVFVSKKQETSTMLLEELTGVACGYCPDGHKKADILASTTFPGKFFIINVHAGSYSNFAPPNDLRTDYGTALVTYSKLTGFPAGMINRTVFPSAPPMQAEAPAMSRTYWEKVCMSIVNNPTYVNVAAKTTINSADRTLSCHVQVYYTSDAPVAVNNINVAVLQNEIIAEQAGGATYYPDRVIDGDKYRHMHILRHFVTGQWGETIDVDLKKDNLYEKTFTWTIPAEMKGHPIPFENVEILVFVTEGVAAPIAKVCKSSIEIK